MILPSKYLTTLAPGSFTLASNQMTKSWVYGYLFRMYQDFLKENIRILETSKRHLRKSHYNHIKIVLFNILHNDYLNDIKMLVNWVKERSISKKSENYLVKEIKRVINKDASEMKLEDYENYFNDLKIIARGNSVVHCKLPIIKEYGFNEAFTEPTYHIRRNLKKEFKKKGSPPQPK
ncbi:MAG: hypothetical protein BGO77_02355 [Caedibacter sp. 37-49]|nr:MAG: hypothetical protein BGO77_02355 [Caedibacter sp. 37-49]